MDKIKLGIIGYGNMGSSHIRKLDAENLETIEVTAICDMDEEKRNLAKENTKDIPVFETAEELMDSGLCNTVLIATYHYSHPTLAIMAFSKGLNVITEKPAGVYTKQVLEMNEAAKNTDKAFGIMYNQRTNPLYQTLREMIQGGELGGLKRVSWIITNWYRPQAYHDSSSWRSTWKDEGGGALINQNPHQLDLWQWLFGMPDRIYANVALGKYHNIEVEDDVCAILEYDNGLVGQYITSTGEAPGTNRLEIACDMGKIVIEGNEMIFYKNEISEREFEKINTVPFGSPKHEVIKTTVENSGEQHIGILKNFASHVLNGEKLLAPGEEGVFGLTISNAIHLSGWTGEKVDVKNFDHDRFYELLEEKRKTSKSKITTTKVTVTNLEGTF